MRQNRPFPPVQSQPQPESEPSWLKSVRKHLNRFYTRFQKVLLVAAGIAVALAAMLIYDAVQPPPQRLTQDDIDAAVERSLANQPPAPSFASQVFEIIRPSVVRVSGLVWEGMEKTEGSMGTGVVIDESGLVLTCLHVVKDSVEIHVVFADGTDSKAWIYASQPENDLAILRPLEVPDDVLPATLGNSAGLQVGDEVVAVGNPFGISSSLSAGVISGLGREYGSTTGKTFTNLIQFDAAVNPGNSGGPLLNRNGEVIGIVMGLLNPSDQEVFIGIGFAVPINNAAAAMPGGLPL
jgi:S1-C subfamily serine protease